MEVESEEAWRSITVAQMGYKKQESETRNMRAFNIPCQDGGWWAMDPKKKDLDMTEVAEEQRKEGRHKNWCQTTGSSKLSLEYWEDNAAIDINRNCTVRRPSLVAQMVKNPPAMRETWVQSLGWEDHLEEGIAIHSRVTKSQTCLSD